MCTDIAKYIMLRCKEFNRKKIKRVTFLNKWTTALVDHVFLKSILLCLERTLILRTIDLLTHLSRSMQQNLSPIEGHYLISGNYMLTTTGESKATQQRGS